MELFRLLYIYRFLLRCICYLKIGGGLSEVKYLFKIGKEEYFLVLYILLIFLSEEIKI